MEYPKPKHFSCKVATNYKLYIKGHKFDSYKTLKNYSFTNCSKTWKYNICAHKNVIFQYIIKKYCTICIINKENTQIMKNYLLNISQIVNLHIIN